MRWKLVVCLALAAGCRTEPRPRSHPSRSSPSYDGTHWANVATGKADGTSTAQVNRSFAVSAGQTTYGWLFTRRHRLSSHARLAAKATGGATKAGDIARASVKAA